MTRRFLNSSSSSSSQAGPSGGTRLKRKLSSLSFLNLGGSSSSSSTSTNKVSPFVPTSRDLALSIKENTQSSPHLPPRPLKTVRLAPLPCTVIETPPPTYEDAVGSQEPPRYSFFRHSTLRSWYKPKTAIGETTSTQHQHFIPNNQDPASLLSSS